MIMVPVGEVVQVGPLNFLGQVGFLCPEIFEAPFCDIYICLVLVHLL